MALTFGNTAIIGLSCRFPEAPDSQSFWASLVEGNDGISRMSLECALKSGVDISGGDSKTNILAKGVLEGAELFDAEFFGMSPRESEITDPQQRLFLEACWNALDDAGYPPCEAAQNIGVFGGSNFNSYMLLKAQAQFDLRRDGLPFDFRIGNDKDYLTTRVSYKLNLTGPSIAVQTACSTSLSALHLACLCLQAGECEMALAGAVSLKFPLYAGHSYEPGGMYPEDGLCRPFDACGEGPPDGDGVAVVALKPLEAAERDSDNILAVIKGAAINNDGSAKVGFTAPSIQGQSRVVSAALGRADVAPESIDFIETHGTATPLGDAIELAALADAYPEKDTAYVIGSVKSNIGHLNVASGMAGLVKTVLALKNGVIPPTINHQQANPNLALSEKGFRVATTAEPWPVSDTPRRAAVSSFGIGATNAHVILESYDPEDRQDRDGAPQLIVLSARTSKSLTEMAGALADFAEREEGATLADIAISTQVGRARFPLRLSASAGSKDDLVRTLRNGNALARSEGQSSDQTQGLGKVESCHAFRTIDPAPRVVLPPRSEIEGTIIRQYALLSCLGLRDRHR
jgi:phthiocerol/phenolphthiocerol synthesis type-I polyketide synthase E